MEFHEKEKKSSNSLGGEVYPSVFSVLILVMLILFISKPGVSLTSVSTDFRWRSNLIGLYSSFRFRIGDRVYNTAVVGKDSWIFYTGSNSVQDYQKTDGLDKNTFTVLTGKLSQLSQKLKEEGKILLIVIPPNKSTIYPQYMPDEIPVLGEQSRLDQFVEQMRLNDSTNIIDLRPVLLNASRMQDVYFKVDTHWNDVGAYYGYREILSFLSRYDSRLVPHPLSDYEYVRQGDLINPDLPLVLGIPTISEEYQTLVPKFSAQRTHVLNIRLLDGGYISHVTGEDSELPRLLVFHDSFYSARASLSHFMEPHFSEITEILFIQDPKIWSLDWIRQTNPDIVIIEIVERNFDVGISLLLDSIGQ